MCSIVHPIHIETYIQMHIYTCIYLYMSLCVSRRVIKEIVHLFSKNYVYSNVYMTTTDVTLNLSGEYKLPEYSDIIGLAKLSILVYEYQKCFKLTAGQNLEDFLKDPVSLQNVPTKCKTILNDLNEVSPHGEIIDFISDPITDIQVGIAKSESMKRISIVFRGSESKRDWLYDFMVRKRKLREEGVYVHGGFYKQLHRNGVFSQLKNKIRELIQEYPTYEVFVSGHSLGAALATLCGYELSHIFEDVTFTVVSFASPRVGNYAFKESCESTKNLRNFRVCNTRDIITSVPMCNYYHTGKAILLTDSLVRIISENYGWFEFSIFTSWSVMEHDMYLYHDRLIRNKW